MTQLWPAGRRLMWRKASRQPSGDRTPQNETRFRRSSTRKRKWSAITRGTDMRTDKKTDRKRTSWRRPTVSSRLLAAAGAPGSSVSVCGYCCCCCCGCGCGCCRPLLHHLCQLLQQCGRASAPLPLQCTCRGQLTQLRCT